jgi:hypothetical protein
VTREETVERVRAWAKRAQHEALEADTWENSQHWQAQSQVLGSVASFLGNQGPDVRDEVIWRSVVVDRERALAEWMAHPETRESAFFAGAVAGYDVALTALKDMAGKIWPKIEPHVG